MSSVEANGFDHWPSHIKDFKIRVKVLLPAKQTVLGDRVASGWLEVRVLCLSEMTCKSGSLVIIISDPRITKI